MRALLPWAASAALCANWDRVDTCNLNSDGGCECLWVPDDDKGSCVKTDKCAGIGITNLHEGETGGPLTDPIRERATYHPKMPDDWSCTIEANIVKPQLNRTYSIARQEIYSTSRDATRVHDFEKGTGLEHVRITRFDKNMTYDLTTKATDGMKFTWCTAHPGLERVEQRLADGTHLRSTLDFFGIAEREGWPMTDLVYVETRPTRGVPADVYRHSVDGEAHLPQGSTVPYHYSLSYFYPDKAYQAHNLGEYNVPSRVALHGRRYDHQAQQMVDFDHTYEFVDVRADLAERELDEAFDPCLGFAGRRVVIGCGCENEAPPTMTLPEVPEEPALCTAFVAAYEAPDTCVCPEGTTKKKANAGTKNEGWTCEAAAAAPKPTGLCSAYWPDEAPADCECPAEMEKVKVQPGTPKEGWSCRYVEEVASCPRGDDATDLAIVGVAGVAAGIVLGGAIMWIKGRSAVAYQQDPRL